MKSNYLNVSYSEEDEKILRATELTKDELNKIEELKVLYEKRAFSSCLEDIYVFRKNDFTTTRIAEIYGVSTRQMQRILKELGINRNKSDARLISLKENAPGLSIPQIPRITNANNINKQYLEEKERLICEGKPLVVFPSEVLEYRLDNETKEQICIKLWKTKGFSNPSPKQYSIEEIFYSIYVMLFEFKYTTGEVAACFKTRSKSTIQKWMKKMGWELDAFEIQQRVVKRGKRDYKQIRNKSKESRLKNGIDKYESLQEDYARKKLNYALPQAFVDCEVIVGLNNISILNKGYEIDIPIIIIKNGLLYKFAIEYNGSYWHSDKERDFEKSIEIKDKGYSLFYFAADGNTPNQRIDQIDSQIESFIKEIERIIN